jgi:hypothetical protein
MFITVLPDSDCRSTLLLAHVVIHLMLNAIQAVLVFGGTCFAQLSAFQDKRLSDRSLL